MRKKKDVSALHLTPRVLRLIFFFDWYNGLRQL